MLCLEHVKEFNKNWNYFSGMNDDQVMNFLKSDMTWHKPTQSFIPQIISLKFYGITRLEMNLIKTNLKAIMIICVNLNLTIKISKPLVFWEFL